MTKRITGKEVAKGMGRKEERGMEKTVGEGRNEGRESKKERKNRRGERNEKQEKDRGKKEKKKKNAKNESLK